MKLEQFREIADETLRDLTIDERMVKRIRQNACTIKVRRKVRVPRASALIAVACAFVMLLSGSVLIKTMRGAPPALPAAPSPGRDLRYPPVDDEAVSILSSSLETSQFIDGTTLSYGIEEVGAFSGGYAPALATNGLYGYVNEDRVWVVQAMYDEAWDVLDGKASVSVQGLTQIIDVP